MDQVRKFKIGRNIGAGEAFDKAMSDAALPAAFRSSARVATALSGCAKQLPES